MDKIRETYKEDWKSKEMRIRQRAVALYFIDKVHRRISCRFKQLEQLEQLDISSH